MEQWQDPETIAIWLALGLLFVLVLVTFIILLIRASFKKAIAKQREDSAIKLNHQRDLLRTSIHAQESERERIAGDLHDELMNKLYTHKISLTEHKDRASIDACINSARRISHDLSPPLLDFTDLPELIQALLHPWRTTYQISYEEDIREDLKKITKEYKLQLVRILSELITNISKHAKASNIRLRLRIVNGIIRIIVSDDGDGLPTSAMTNGLGLKSIESRIQIINGAIKLKSQPNMGTRVIINVDLNN